MRMRREGSREELVTELYERAEGWHHLCKDKLRDESAQAAAALEAGAESVTVGHTEFRVIE